MNVLFEDIFSVECSSLLSFGRLRMVTVLLVSTDDKTSNLFIFLSSNLNNEIKLVSVDFWSIVTSATVGLP